MLPALPVEAAAAAVEEAVPVFEQAVPAAEEEPAVAVQEVPADEEEPAVVEEEAAAAVEEEVVPGINRVGTRTPPSLALLLSHTSSCQHVRPTDQPSSHLSMCTDQLRFAPCHLLLRNSASMNPCIQLASCLSPVKHTAQH